MDNQIDERLTLNVKSTGMDEMLNAVAENLFGRPRKSGFCVQCGREVRPEDFRDELSLKEYKISALCQECQDEIFQQPDEEEWVDGESY